MRRRDFLVTAGAATLCAPAVRAQQALGDVMQDLPRINTLQILRGDDVVLADSRRAGGLDRVANIKSCSKSVLGLLLGAAVARGEVALDTTLGEAAPGLIPADATEGVAAITMEDLVTLRAGLAPTSGANYGAWVASPDWVAYVLRQPMVDRPGGRMIYSTGSSHVLGAALAEVTGQSLLSQARERIGRPMGLDVSPWTQDPQGRYLGGNNMGLTPRGMLDIAVTMRDGGLFEARQVVAADWVRASARPRTQSPWSGMDYGYGWFLTDSGYMLARGYGGQVIAAHPARGLAVALTSDPTQPARSNGYFGEIMRLLNGPILAA
ncbi:serine hydrolase domain-containing protein [Marinibacterium sp. SX1]|uniref:serine hydrolase domain-containing protein n=1 Tax=Marinibacterium sp. SX1 TaxID=3388424 RepID=UPI003D167EE1